MGNTQIIKQRPHLDLKKNITFGGKEEEEMVQRFNTHDIIWYAPENSEKLEEWRAFTNVNVIKVSKEEVFNVFLLMAKMSNYIVITTGSFAEKFVPQFGEDAFLADIIIYCMNVDYHKEWSKKYKSVVGVFTHPNQIFQYLLKRVIVPIFTYKINMVKEFNFNYYDNIRNIDFLVNQQNFDLKLNKYEKFCADSLIFFNLANHNNGTLTKFRLDASELIYFFYGITIDIYPDFAYCLSGLNLFDTHVKYLIHNFIALTAVSLYFSKLPYLYGYLNYEEIADILKKDLEINEIRKDFEELHNNHLNFLMKKLNVEEISILEDKIQLKFLHAFLIKFLKFIAKNDEGFESKDYFKYPFMIKYLFDLDFCLKLFFSIIYGYYKNNHFRNKCRGSLKEVDKRIMIYQNYTHLKYYKELALKSVSQEDFNDLNESLNIRDFIVIGNTNFQNEIKGIKDFFINSELLKIQYLLKTDLREFLNWKLYKNRSFYYFIIIEGKEAEELYKELYSVKNDFALVLGLIIYLKDKQILINKRPFLMANHLPIFLAYNTKEIIDYVNCQENLNAGINFLNQTKDIMNALKFLSSLTKIKIPKIEFEDENIVDKLSTEDGWELVDAVPKEVFRKAIFGNANGDFISDQFALNLFEVFKENKIDNNISNSYYKYFFSSVFPELMILTVNVKIKLFCYAYTLHFDKSSLYFLMNKDLRQGIASKAEKYFEIISMIHKSFETNEIKSFKGKLYRAAAMKTDIIEKKLIVGKALTNLSFWSASQNPQIAYNYLKDPFRNILFIIETEKNNIDIDGEKISNFENEREVLFLPYSKFMIKSKEEKLFQGKKIYEVNIIGLDDDVDERENITSYSLPNEMTDLLINK